MPVPEPLSRLFAHMEWADERVRTALAAAPPMPRAIELFAHVLGAEEVWLARLEQRTPGVPVWPPIDLDACTALARATAAGYRAFLSALGERDLARPVRYRNSAGREFESRVDDMLVHVAMHGSYHRGQIALLVRDAGAEPNPTDYIAFVRGAPAATRTR